MKYAGYMPNDFLDGTGICVSLWTQGCPHHCKNCHNPETWDFDGGYEVPYDIIDRINKAISSNDIQRNFSILGGEPLCPENKKFVSDVINGVRDKYPNIKIYLWTGYTIEYLKSLNDDDINNILNKINTLIDGPYVEELHSDKLYLRGSSNQRIIELN